MPQQVKWEILQLLRLVEQLQPKLLIEIGTANGETLFLLSRVAAEDATIISIDLPGWVIRENYPPLRNSLFRSFILPTQRLLLLRSDSHDEATLHRVRDILGDNRVDLLFLDGD